MDSSSRAELLTLAARARTFFSAILILCSLPAFAQDQGRFLVAWRDRPSLRVGDFLRVDLTSKVQADVRALSPDIATDEGVFDMQRVRLGIEGTVWDDFEYQVEREFRHGFGGRDVKYPWRDVYANFRKLDDFQIQVGKFKIPFSQEQLRSASRLDFISRSRLADDLSPGRDIGIVMHGRFFNRGFGYEAGVFRTDGENSDSASDTRGKRTWVVRVTGSPLRLLSAAGIFRNTVFAIGFVSSNIPEGLNSLRGRTHSGNVFFPSVFAKGPRRRFNVEGRWERGPFSVAGEFLRLSEARLEQSVRQEDLPAAVSLGWYLAATWVFTGESKENSSNPSRPFLRGGIGAMEIAARLEGLRMGRTASSGLAYTSPRAPNIQENADQAATVGINWYLNRYVRVQVNSIFEKIEDPDRSPLDGRTRFWMGIARVQFSM